jgi:hypothetical protein
MWMLAVLSATASELPAGPVQSRALTEYKARAVYVVPLADGTYELRDGRNRQVGPGRFAERTGDWLTWHRYDYEVRVARTVSVGFYAVGGALALAGANLLPVLADGYTDPTWNLVARLTGGGMVVTGFAFIVSGYGVYRLGRARVSDPSRWWDQEQATALATSHNDALQERLGLSDDEVNGVGPRSGLELQLGLMPNGVAVAGRW